jgi:hypothetical protein
MTYEELVRQHSRTEKEIHAFAKTAYARCLAGDVFLCEQRIDDDLLFAPVPEDQKQFYVFDEFEIHSDGLHLVGEWFVGGESEYIRTTVPFGLLDDLDGFIEKKKADYAASVAAREQEKERDKAADQAEVEHEEREQLARLKEKYESVASLRDSAHQREQNGDPK